MTELSIAFPKAGIDVSQAVGKQPNRPAVNQEYARTCPVGINVRTYDADGRSRGGSRPGLTKFIAARPHSVKYVTQYLGVLVVTGASPVQPSQSGRRVLLVAVSQGTVYYMEAGDSAWTTPTNNTGETPALNVSGLVRAASYGDKLYFVDGTNYCYFDGMTGTVEAWTASSGSMPVDSGGNKARLICTWRGAIILSGLLLDPTGIFRSKIGDPRNWDYSPATPVPADSAWSGATGPQGKCGDVVTALIPYTDDLMVIGMDSSMAVFRGDPMAGGSIDNVTTTIGMAWGEAWGVDPQGIVYFFSNRTGIFRFVPGSLPERVSIPIDSLLLGVDTGQYGVRLLWNDRYKGLHVFITLLAEEFDTTHYFWESQSNSWWQDNYADTSLNPLCCTFFDGNLQNDRVALIGSWDGYIRSVSSTAEDDDGTPIASEVWIGPTITKFNDRVMVNEVQGVLGADSGDVQYAIFVADTAEEALAAASTADGTWVAGRNFTDTVRRSGYACYVKMTSVVAWAMENIRMSVDVMGKTFQRGK